jgi:hypothetical protein
MPVSSVTIGAEGRGLRGFDAARDRREPGARVAVIGATRLVDRIAGFSSVVPMGYHPGMLTPLLAVGLALTSAFADDVPPGTDVAVRVAAGELGLPVLAAVDELRPLAAGWGQLGAALATLDAMRQGPWREALTAVGVDPAGKGVVVTAFADLADPKRPVIAAIVRGVKPRQPQGAGLEAREVEGQPAAMVTGQDLVLVSRPTEVVIGNERGVERLLRHLGARAARSKKPVDPLVTAARRLRQEAPVLLALAPAAVVKGLGADKVPGLAPLSQSIGVATLALTASALEIVLDVDRPGQREAVASAVRGAIAALNGAGQGLLALGELAAAGPQLTPSLPLLPRGLDPKLFSAVVTTWTRDFRLTPAVHVRPHGVEARVEVSSWRGLVASVLALGASGAAMRGGGGREPAAPPPPAPGEDLPEAAPSPLAMQAESLLVRLREAELTYKHAHGSFVACALSPAQAPKVPTPWKPDDCFAKVGFAPEGVVTLLQLEARVEGDKLALTARADPGGDGVPAVFYLDDQASTVRRQAPEGGAAEP